MKKLLFSVCVIVVYMCPAMSQIFISDQQTTIAKKATEIKKHPPKDRTIILDSLNGVIKMEMLDGTILKRNIKFIKHVSEQYGVVYDGHYETNQGENIYKYNHEINFDASETLGYFISYKLKGTKQPTEEEKQIEDEQSTYKHILIRDGQHDADCYKYKKIEKGIDVLTVGYILDEPIFKEYFLKGENYITISVHKEYIIRYVNLKIDQILMNK